MNWDQYPSDASDAQFERHLRRQQTAKTPKPPEEVKVTIIPPRDPGLMWKD